MPDDDRFEILVEPRAPNDPNPEHLSALRAELASAFPNVDVWEAWDEQRGAGVTFQEIVNIWIPWSDITSAAAGVVVTILVQWLKERHKECPTRPKLGRIYGPDGRVVRSFHIEGSQTQPETSSEQSAPRPMPPKRTKHANE